MSDEGKPVVRVTRVGPDRFRVVTERYLTKQELLSEGFEPPEEMLPWREVRPAPPPWRRRGATSEQSPLQTAIAYWRTNVSDNWVDPRLPKVVHGAIRDLGLEAVLRAFDEVKAQRSYEPKFDRLLEVFRSMRGGDL